MAPRSRSPAKGGADADDLPVVEAVVQLMVNASLQPSAELIRLVESVSAKEAAVSADTLRAVAAKGPLEG